VKWKSCRNGRPRRIVRTRRRARWLNRSCAKGDAGDGALTTGEGVRVHGEEAPAGGAGSWE